MKEMLLQSELRKLNFEKDSISTYQLFNLKMKFLIWNALKAEIEISKYL